MAFKYNYETPDGKVQSLTSDRELSDDELDDKIYEKMQMSQPKTAGTSKPDVDTSAPQPIQTPSNVSKLSPTQENTAKQFLAQTSMGSVDAMGQFQKGMAEKVIDHTPDVLRNLGNKLNSGIAYIGPDIKKTVQSIAGYRSPEQLDGMMTQIANRANELEAGGMSAEKALNTALFSAQIKKNSQDVAQVLVAAAQTYNPVNKAKGALLVAKAIGITSAKMGVANGMADFVQQLTNGETVEDAAKHGFSVGSTIAVTGALISGTLGIAVKGTKMSADKVKSVLASPTSTYMQKVFAEKFLTKAKEITDAIQGRIKDKSSVISDVNLQRAKLKSEKDFLMGTSPDVDTQGASTLKNIASHAAFVASKMGTKVTKATKTLSDRGHAAMSLMYSNIFNDPKMKSLPDIDISDVSKIFENTKLPSGSEGALFFKTVLNNAISDIKEVTSEGVMKRTDTLTKESSAGKFKISSKTVDGAAVETSKSASLKGSEYWGTDIAEIESKLDGNLNALNPKQIHFLISSIRGWARKSPKDVNNAEFSDMMFTAADKLADKLGAALDSAGLEPQYKATTKKYKDLLQFDKDTMPYQNMVKKDDLTSGVDMITNKLNIAFDKVDGGRYGVGYGVDDIVEEMSSGYGEIFKMAGLAKDLGLEAESTQLNNITRNLVNFSLSKYKILKQQVNPASDIKDDLFEIYKKTSGDVNNVVGAENFAKNVIQETQEAINILHKQKKAVQSSKEYLSAEHAVKEYKADREDYSVVSGAVMLGAFSAATLGILALVPGSAPLKTGVSGLIGLANIPLLIFAAKKHGAISAKVATDSVEWLGSKMDDVLKMYESTDIGKLSPKQSTKLRSLMEVQLPKMVNHFKNEFGAEDNIPISEGPKESDPFSSEGFDLTPEQEASFLNEGRNQ